MKYSPEPAEANTILCLENFHSKAKRISPLPHVKLWQASEIAGWLDNEQEPRLRDGELKIAAQIIGNRGKTGRRIINYENKFPTENKILTDW